MTPKVLIPLIYILAGLLIAIVSVGLVRGALGEFAPLALTLAGGLVGCVGGVVTRDRWHRDRAPEREPPA